MNLFSQKFRINSVPNLGTVNVEFYDPFRDTWSNPFNAWFNPGKTAVNIDYIYKGAVSENVWYKEKIDALHRKCKQFSHVKIWV